MGPFIEARVLKGPVLPSLVVHIRQIQFNGFTFSFSFHVGVSQDGMKFGTLELKR